MSMNMYKNFIKKTLIWTMVVCVALGGFVGGEVEKVGAVDNLGSLDIDGVVKTVAINSATNTAYIGGNFHNIGGSNVAGNAIIDSASGQIKTFFPEINGRVYASVSDDVSGVTYIGGQFTTVGGQSRNNVAAFNTATGEVTSFNPNANGIVKALLLSGSTLYLSGWFNSIGGVSKPFIGAVNATTGYVINDFNPSVNMYVSTMVLSGSTLYISGYFSSVGGQSRNMLAAVDAITGAVVTDFNPNPNGWPSKLIISGNILYINGNFSTVGGQTRNKLATIDITNNELSNFNPNVNGSIFSLALSDSTLYIGGVFTTVGGVTRNNLAAVDSVTGALVTDFNPNIISPDPNSNSYIYSLVLSGSTLYIGGRFTTVGGVTRNNLAAVDAITGSLITDFNPNVQNNFAVWNGNGVEVKRMEIYGSTLYFFGKFNSVGGTRRMNMASINILTGELTSFDPNINNPNYDIPIDFIDRLESNILISGDFTSINKIERNGLAGINMTTGEVTNFNPNIGGGNISVNKIILSNNVIYVGGYFTTVGEQSRSNFAAINESTGLVTNLIKDTDNVIQDMVLAGSKIYLGGAFSSIGGQGCSRVGGINLLDNNVISFSPEIGGTDQVHALYASGNILYVGGSFTFVGGGPSAQQRHKLLSYDLTTNEITDFDPDFGTYYGDAVYAITKFGNNLYVGGTFSSVNGVGRNNLAAIDSLTGVVDSFNPNINSIVYSMALLDTNLYIGGYFTTVGGVNRNSLAEINLNTSQLTSTNLDVLRDIGGGYYNNGSVHSLTQSNNHLYVTGDYDLFRGVLNNNLSSMTFKTLSISPTHTTLESSTSTPTSITVSLDQTDTSDITFSLNSSGTAVLNTDYTLDNTTYTIPAGQTSVNVLLTPIDNFRDESNKTVDLTLVSTDAFISDTQATSTITITDNDTFGTTSTDNSMIVHNNQTTGVYKIKLNSQPRLM
jgi:hypothetical protein